MDDGFISPRWEGGPRPVNDLVSSCVSVSHSHTTLLKSHPSYAKTILCVSTCGKITIHHKWASPPSRAVSPTLDPCELGFAQTQTRTSEQRQKLYEFGYHNTVWGLLYNKEAFCVMIDVAPYL